MCARLYCLPAPGDALSEPAVEQRRNLCTHSYMVSFFLFHNGKGQFLSLEPAASKRALESLESRNAETL